ncbi:hypothetical protein Tco_0665163 [Tanacetum coccineum]
MADSWKAMDLNRFVVKDDMIDYVLHKYGSNWQVHDAIADDILDDLLKREWEKQKRVKYDKRKVTQMKIQDLIEKRIEIDVPITLKNTSAYVMDDKPVLDRACGRFTSMVLTASQDSL